MLAQTTHGSIFPFCSYYYYLSYDECLQLLETIFLLNRVSDFRARTYSHIQWVSPEQNRSIMCPGGYVAVGIKTDVRRTPCCGFGYHVGPLTNNVHMALCCKNEWKGHHSFCGGAFCPLPPTCAPFYACWKVLCFLVQLYPINHPPYPFHETQTTNSAHYTIQRFWNFFILVNTHRVICCCGVLGRLQ